MWTADEIARLCYEHYRTRLPKQGKPEPNREWTLLAAVVKIQPAADQAHGGNNRPAQGEAFSPPNRPSLSELVVELFMAMLGLSWLVSAAVVGMFPLLSTRWRSACGRSWWCWNHSPGLGHPIGMLWRSVHT